MFIPEWGIALLAGFFLYLVSMDIHLHHRVRRLEATVRKLEGLTEKQPIRYDLERQDVS